MRGAAGTIGLVVALAMASSPASAHGAHRIKATLKSKHKHEHEETKRVSKEPFGNIPKGPLQIIISVNQQRLHLYSDGAHIADAMIATGVPEHPTPMGVFSVIDKERFHRSNIYSGAPMPFMQRITWSGVAMHEGVGLGHPASHGCIRMPGEFAARLWLLHSLGARVIIARPELRPVEFADPHLFVHKELPPAPVPTASAPVAVEAVKTAQTIDSSKKTDALPPSIPIVSTSNARNVAAAVADALTPGVGAAAAADGAAGTDGAALRVKPSTPAEVDPPDTPAPLDGAASSDPPKADPPAGAAPQAVPLPVPLPAPAAVAKAKKGEPIAIFVSRKTGRIYVRQNFAPLFAAPITIAHPQQPLGTHVFTAMEYLHDGTTLRWNVVSLPGEQPKAARDAKSKPEREAKGRRRHEPAAKPVLDPRPPETPQQALARIEIPQDVIEQISALIVPGSSLVISDQGLGEETGEGTDFIVVAR